jgi:predicted dehydrogenase
MSVMSRQPRLTLGQLGCGYWGPNLLRKFSRQPDCDVKWVAEPSAERRNYVSQYYSRASVTPEWREVVEDPEVDAVVVATPAASHFQLVRAALLASKHVFVEKPLALSIEEADELIKIAAAGQRILMVGHTFLYNAAVNYAKEILDRGELGDLHYVYSQRLNLGQVRSDVNVWWNLAPHDVSILLYLMDGVMPVSIDVQGMSYIQPGIEDVVFATLAWANGVAAHIHVSWLDPGRARKMTLVGSRKMVVYDDTADDKIAVIDKGIDRVPRAGERMDYDQPNYHLRQRAGDTWLPMIDVPEPLRVEAAHFLACIRTGRTPTTGPAHARSVVAVLEAGQRSLKGRRSSPVEALELNSPGLAW